ncbi:MAG: phosphoglycerate kinase [Desulfurococcales archaeon]|nr:phosphoglycerate kinase [Desulfurococcales archaeon]
MSLSYLGRRIPTLSDVDVEGKTVLLRVDINSPIGGNGEILDDTRFKAHIPTIRELMERNAKIVILAHQGRPFGSDFTRLEAHAKKLSELLGGDVGFVPDLIGPAAKKAVNSLRPGQVLLLDNTRLYSEESREAPPEELVKTILARELASMGDIYVNDAFAVSHRSQVTVAGIPRLLPSAAGRLLEKEIKALSRALSVEESPKVFVLGGAKLKDTVKIISYLVTSGAADEILTTGLVGLLFLMVSGINVGEASKIIEKKVDEKTLNLARKLIAESNIIRVPLDFVAEVDSSTEVVMAHEIIGAPKDIGPSTIEYYSYKMARAKVIVMRGPAGVIEDPRFRRGTRQLVEFALSSTKAYTIFGGGHFNAILSELPDELKERVGHVSTGGGALLYFLSGRILPGLEALISPSKDRLKDRGK